MPILTKLIYQTSGDVLELGMGLYSTPLLHWLCFDQGRRLVSFDSQQQYYDINKNFQSDLHEVNLIDDWNKADIVHPWSIAFVDHEPAHRRIEDIKRLAYCSLYVVVHDTEPRDNKFYRYDKIFPLFKYRFDYTKNEPNTSVFSNYIDLNFLK